jgi:hypothetical protein
MSVSDVHVEYIRAEGYRDLMDWCADPQNVYVGRAGVVFVTRDGEKFRYPKTNSPFANPFKVGKDGDLETVLDKYEEYIVKRLDNGELGRELLALRGKNLGCWCVECSRTTSVEPRVCHAQILLTLLGFIERGGVVASIIYYTIV